MTPFAQFSLTFFAWIFGGLLLFCGFFWPAAEAFRRDHPDRWLILLGNLTIAASGFGWFALPVWATRYQPEPPPYRAADRYRRREPMGRFGVS